jgi:hypothetical protein
VEDIKEELIRAGMPRDLLEPVWNEALEIAHAISRIVPNIGFLSKKKRLNAYLVASGHLSTLDAVSCPRFRGHPAKFA